MSRRAKETPGVALFPFLAVLICTMGALILLLVIIARQARLQAERAAADALPKVPQSRFEAEFVQLRIDALRANRRDADEELIKHRSVLVQIEARYRELKDQLVELEAARANLQRMMAGDTQSPHRAELSRLQARIVDLKSKLAEARARGASAEPTFAIVPYDGPNGTRRRPIYIECQADKIVLQPEGIELTEDDFSGPLGPGNPLAAGLRAAVEHVNRNRRAGGGDSGEAYPLLLIRPDGINAYYAARAALRSWGADFGYEFVDGDWKLDYGERDPVLANVEKLAVDDAREKQVQLAGVDLGGGYGGRPFRGRYRVGASGNLVREDGGDAEPPRFRVNPSGGGLVREGGSRSSVARGGFGGFGGDRRGAFGNSSTTAKPGTTAQRGNGADATAREFGSDARPGTTSNAFSQHRDQQSPPSHNDGLAGGYPRGPSSNQGQGSGDSQLGGSNPSAASNNIGGFAHSGSKSQTGGGAGMPGGQPSDTAMASDQQLPPIVPQQIFGQHEKGESGGGESQSMAKSRGRDWGLPNAARGSFPITRPIRIQCHADRIVLLPDSPASPAKEIALKGRTSESIDDFVAGVWEHIDAWGIAGKGMYWRPILHAEASPSGMARLADLKVLLADSGLVIRDRVESAEESHGVRR